LTTSTITSATGTSLTDSTTTNPNGMLGKDDFLKLLLVELQHQDPTEPMDSEKILSQTSELATLESAENTNKALENLAASLSNNMQFSTIAAIGKMADLGSDSIALDTDGENSSFDIYFPTDIASAQVEIRDNDGALIQTVNVGSNPKGVYNIDWDGLSLSGNAAEAGIYHVTANYVDSNGESGITRLGAYPIESVRFDGGKTLVKVGSSYIPFESIYEVY
jgi:flagellar basal-body rod modification protein FlgD